MATPQVAALLARSVRTGRITEETARQLATKPFSGNRLPLPPAQGLVSRESEGRYVRAYEGKWKGENAVRLGQSEATRAKFRDALQKDFEKQSAALAESVASGKLSVGRWQRNMADAVSNHTIRQAALGRGKSHTKAEVQRTLVPKVQADLAYLQRFADEIALREAMGNPMSAKAIAARAGLYAGTGRAEWFAQNESAAAIRPGMVVRYRARDDNGTCRPCRKAEGYYLPGTGPLPGAICEGRSRCRCTRQLVENQTMYDRLTGGIAPSTAQIA